MKVAQIMLGKGYGGAERAFVDICLALADTGHEVLAIIDRDFSAQAQLKRRNNITIAAIPIYARWDPIARYRVKNILQTDRPEIAHVHLRRAMAVAGSSIKKCKIPLIASLHNYGNVTAYSDADGLIALTEGHRKYITQHPGFLQSAMQSNAVTTIPNFSRFPLSGKVIRETDPLKFLAYGRFVPKKGFDVLIEAIALAKKANPNIRLTLIGDGPEKAALMKKIHASQLHDQITVKGWQQNLIPTLDQHDVFVLPSRSEPFGIVLLEAMARGLGIISTRTEGPAEFLDEKCCDFVEIDSADGLAMSINQASTARNDLQQKARRAQHRFKVSFSQAAVIEQLEKKYQRFIGA